MEPEITEARLARQWASIEGRRPLHAPRRSLLRYAALALPVACAAIWLAWSQRPPVLGRGGVVESADSPVTIKLHDGSSVELAAQSRLRVLRDQPSAVTLEVGEGRAQFDVTHVKGRAFEVRAGSVSVRVVGTKFEVLKASREQGTQVQVVVSRGVVEIRRSDRDAGVRRLSAGETWSAWIAAQAPASAELQPPSAPNVASEPEPDVVGSAAAVPRPRSVERRAATRRTQERGGADSARKLFTRANIARRAGRMPEAADAYAELLRRFPHNSRAGVAAFELGRIRMDALADPGGAAQAFAEALRHGRRATFREDALARLVIAYDALGEGAACRRVRGQYLAQYPSGVHVGAVTSLCGVGQP